MTDIAALAKKPQHHQPAFAQGCATCHTPTAATSIICCGSRAIRAASSAMALTRLRSRMKPIICSPSSTAQVKLPEDYYKKNKVAILPLRFGLGHPVDGHPVSDVMDPANRQGQDAAQLSLLPSAARFGSARPAGQRPGQQHGVLR